MKSRMITPEQAGDLLQITPRRIRTLIRAGEIPGVRLGHTYRVDRVKLEERLTQGVANQKD